MTFIFLFFLYLYCFVLAFAIDRSNLEARIIAGEDAEPHEASYIISLASGEFTTHRCGGSLLTESGWILTAMHCFKFVLYARAGFHSFNHTEGVQARKIYKWVTYQDISVDLLLVKVVEPFTLPESRVSIVQLPNYDVVPKGKLQLYGWGRTINFTRPSTLQTADMMYVSLETCLQYYKWGNETILSLFNYHICAGYLSAACQGDSGGPLVEILNNNEVQLVGVLSFGRKNCDIAQKQNLPSVFIRLGPFLPWIKTIIAG